MAVRYSRGRKRARLVAATLAVAIGASLAVPARAAGPINWSTAKDHWSFRPPAAQPLPAVKRKDWPRQPLDHFILARLEQAGLTPSAEADARTLIRRVTLDLTGLPPTAEEVEQFVKEVAVERAQRSASNRSSAKRTPSPAPGYTP